MDAEDTHPYGDCFARGAVELGVKIRAASSNRTYLNRRKASEKESRDERKTASGGKINAEEEGRNCGKVVKNLRSRNQKEGGKDLLKRSGNLGRGIGGLGKGENIRGGEPKHLHVDASSEIASAIESQQQNGGVVRE